jgi:hypothetical protein
MTEYSDMEKFQNRIEPGSKIQFTYKSKKTGEYTFPVVEFSGFGKCHNQKRSHYRKDICNACKGYIKYYYTKENPSLVSIEQNTEKEYSKCARHGRHRTDGSADGWYRVACKLIDEHLPGELFEI